VVYGIVLPTLKKSPSGVKQGWENHGTGNHGYPHET